jgi:2-polyprenyl-3-methyl-5-hydroxy-6-metoxy-1,4-benzoquinol methylase
MKAALRKEQTKARYSKGWVPFNSDLPRIETILRLVGKNKRVLDIGCYDGHIAERLLNNGNQVYGVDSSPQAVKLACTKGIKAVSADIEEDVFPFAERFFDCIVAAEIIEHLFDTDAFLEKIKRLLVDRGELIITTPNLATFGRRLMLLLGKNPLIEVSSQGDAGGHIRYFVKESLFGLLKEHGFSIEIFTSDVINFNNQGDLFWRWPARLFPSLGKSLIVKARVLS